MTYAHDITDPIVYSLSNPVSNQSYSPTGVAYDIAIGGQPFFMDTADDSPYRRVTAQYRKNQIDMSREPGEQTITGWWLRSQSSFHLGQGIKFFEPAQDESLRFQYTYSKGCNVWEKGQVTLLNDLDAYSSITSSFYSNTRPYQQARSITYSNKNAVLLWSQNAVSKVDEDGTITSFITSATPVYAICDDGVYAYWVTNDNTTGKLKLLKKLLTSDSTTGSTTMFTDATVAISSNAIIEYTKQRLVLAVDNSVYEIATSATVLPTAVYSNPASGYVYTSITSSGAAIYLAGFIGVQSTIQKFTLTSNGTMPVLTSAITAAELPVGEIVYKICYYLDLMGIGTSKGIRMAAISSTDGSISYGPLIVQTEQPVYDVAFRDQYLWCATNVDGNPGLTRINLAQGITSLVYAYAWDLYDPNTTGQKTTAVAFAGNTSRLIFVTANNGTTNGKIYIQSTSRLIPQGILHVGYIRYNTLENKLFKYITPRFDSTYGGMSILSVGQDGTEYNIGSFPQGSTIGQIGISYPTNSQQYIGFEFTFSRSTIDSTKGPLFTGYQVKSLLAIPRQRLVQYPISLYDSESDKFGNKAGYEGSAYDRLKDLETIESNGDTIKIDDFRTGESYTGIIEEIDFVNKTPTDKRYSGFGGLMLVTIRSMS
jgi:hypothetical protein